MITDNNASRYHLVLFLSKNESLDFTVSQFFRIFVTIKYISNNFNSIRVHMFALMYNLHILDLVTCSFEILHVIAFTVEEIMITLTQSRELHAGCWSRVYYAINFAMCPKFLTALATNSIKSNFISKQWDDTNTFWYRYFYFDTFSVLCGWNDRNYCTAKFFNLFIFH